MISKTLVNKLETTKKFKEAEGTKGTSVKLVRQPA
jgi:hypothetical protein